jgi:hypothetical protein
VPGADDRVRMNGRLVELMSLSALQQCIFGVSLINQFTCMLCVSHCVRRCCVLPCVIDCCSVSHRDTVFVDTLDDNQ